MTGSKTIVTLGMCVRNGEEQIEDALKRIVEQDFPHNLLEVVFVDDGSEDKTLSIINSWKEKSDIKIKIFSYSWRGLGKSRNTILNNTEGDYILWVDCDTI